MSLARAGTPPKLYICGTPRKLVRWGGCQPCTEAGQSPPSQVAVTISDYTTYCCEISGDFFLDQDPEDPLRYVYTLPSPVRCGSTDYYLDHLIAHYYGVLDDGRCRYCRVAWCGTDDELYIVWMTNNPGCEFTDWNFQFQCENLGCGPPYTTCFVSTIP